MGSGVGLTVLREGRDYVVVRARCHKDWPVAWPGKIGHCGECGQVPEVVFTADGTPELWP